jgi:hypothetical protein
MRDDFAIEDTAIFGRRRGPAVLVGVFSHEARGDGCEGPSLRRYLYTLAALPHGLG